MNKKYPAGYITIDELKEIIRQLPDPRLTIAKQWVVPIPMVIELAQGFLLPNPDDVYRLAYFECVMFVEEGAELYKWVLSSNTKLIV